MVSMSTFKGSKSIGHACCELNGLRHEFQISLRFYDGSVSGVFLNRIYGTPAKARLLGKCGKIVRAPTLHRLAIANANTPEASFRMSLNQ